MRKIFTLLVLAAMTNLAIGQEIITQWTFNGVITPSTGEGTAALIGGTTQHSATLTSGWRITSFPDQGVGTGTAGVSFMVSTAGFENIVLNFEQQASNTMSRWAEIQYTVDGGDNWIVHENNNGGLAPGGSNYPFQFDFSSIEEANNSEEFGVRVVSIFSPVAFNPTVPNQEYDANSAYHRANATDFEGNAYAGSGNWRFLNVTFSGDPILETGATVLSITSINGGNPVVANQPFSLTIVSLNNDEEPAAVEADTEVTLTLETGIGILSGNLTGTIIEGTSTVTITGILYDVVETGVSITASATGLASATTDPFAVVAPTYALTLASNPLGAGLPSGAGLFEEGESVTVIANAKDGFNFINWTFADESVASTDESYTFDMPAEPLHLTANFEVLAGEELVHYWHFNDLPSGTLTSVDADFSAFGTATITYPGEGAGYMDRVSPGSTINDYMEAEAGFALRLRNPADTREMIMVSPSTGYEGLFLAFVAHRSTAGAQQQELYYSIDGGDNWVQVGDAYDIQPIEPDYEIFNFDLSGIEEINNNADLQFRILFTGSNASGTSGNQRIDNISITGTLIPAGGAEALSIVSVNGGNPVIAGATFTMQVQAQDAEGIPAEVEADTEVTLTLETGTGILSGNLNGTILEGTTSVTITGILYDTAEENISITASADGLTSVTSSPFTVIAQTYALTLSSNIPGAGVLTGAGLYEEGEEITVTAQVNEGYSFVSWTFDDESVASNEEEYTFNMPAEALNLTANFQQVGDVLIIHYWHFNTLSGTVTEVEADFSAVGTGLITYPGTGDGYMDERTHRAADPVSNLNLLMGQEPDQGAVLRVRNPSDTRELIIAAPSTGFENIEVAFAITRTSNGAQEQEFYYSADGGENWTIVGSAYPVPELDVNIEGNGWELKTFDLSIISEINNNANLQFRVLFVGEGAANLSGNNRFDNLSVTGNQLQVSVIAPMAKELRVYPNPAKSVLYLENLDSNSQINIYSITGKLVISSHSMNSKTELDVSRLSPGVYIIRVTGKNTARPMTTRIVIQ